MIYCIKKDGKYLGKYKSTFVDKLEDAFVYNKLSKATKDSVSFMGEVTPLKIIEMKVTKGLCRKPMGACSVCKECGE